MTARPRACGSAPGRAAARALASPAREFSALLGAARGDLFEEGERLRTAVDEDFELFGLEPFDETALPVEHGDARLHQRGLYLHDLFVRLLRRGLLPLLREGGERECQQQRGPRGRA